MRAARLCLGLAVALLAGIAAAQEADPGPEAVIAEARALCAAAPEGDACHLAALRAEALVANAIAEAGRSRDRGEFLDLTRRYLAAGAPELRAAAAYALARLAPDAEDTPQLLALLRDPVSSVRDGAWAACAASSDPAARLAQARFPDRPSGARHQPDPAPFDPAAPGLTLPEGAEYLWLAAPLRERGALHFLASGTREDTLAGFAAQAGQPARPLTEALATWPVLSDFAKAQVFGAVHVVPFGNGPEGAPSVLVAVYDDLLFQRAGFAVVFLDRRNLVPTRPATPEPEPQALPDDAAFDEALLRRSGLKPEAPSEETELYLAIAAAGGVAAEDYLELYPEGAYAAEMRATLAAPRLELDATRYAETDRITVSLANLPPGTRGPLTVERANGDRETVTSGWVEDSAAGPVTLDPGGRLRPGVYAVVATMEPPEGEPVLLRREFSVELALATLAMDKVEFAPGETMTARFKGMSGSSQDYVATALAGSSNTSYVAYAYTNGAREGALTLPAPGTPGAYELRAFFDEDESVLRASLPFSVIGTATVVQPAHPALPKPPAGGPSDDARASLTLNKAVYAPGEGIVVTYSGMFGASNDYVTTTEAGAPNTRYLNYEYTAGAHEGVLTLLAPGIPGAYEVRAFFQEDEAILRASVPFTVAGAPGPAPASVSGPADDARATLVLDRTTYAPGATITVTYSGMFGAQDDYLSTAEAGSPNGRYLAYQYTAGAQDGVLTLAAPSAPGSYEVRAFFREDETILRGSVAFTVR